ncbi:TPA: hypothetical protein ACH3X2_001814 [Trebouxia sp. C0005]
MRRNAKSNRAPLAPLHDNSLKGDSSHKLFNGTKMDAKSAARVTNKPTAKSSTSQVKLSDKAVANLAGSTYLTGHKTAGRPSPVKPRKTVQLVTTSAAQPRSEKLARIKQAVRKSGRETQPSGLGRPTRQLAASASAARQTETDMQDAAHAIAGALSGAQSTEPPAKLDDAEPDAQTPANVTQCHWRLPGTPPSIRALLGPLQTPAAAAATNSDMQYMQTQQQTVSDSAVQGAGTPQDFSDVFDLDEVSGQTPGGAATFVGYRDKTPGLILDTPDHAPKDNHSLHTWLSASPTLAPMHSPRSLSSHQLALAATKQRQVTPQTVLSSSTVAAPGAGRGNLATPAAAEILKGLRIKTPQLGTSSTAALLRSSPFLAQLLRTAPAPSPATAQLASPVDSASSSVGAAASPSSALTISRGEIVTVTDFASPESVAVTSPDPLPPRAMAAASMESAGSNSPRASSKDCNPVSDSECVTPVLSETAAESAFRQALVRLASSEKVIRLMSPVDLDAPHGNANPHATFTPATLSLPKFTLAALDSPKAHTAALTRQPSGSVNGPEDAALASSPVSSQSQVVPIQAVVSQLLSSPKLAITGSDTAQDDKLPYQTLLQHLLGAGQTAANSPGVAPSCSGPAKDDLGPIIISAHNPACAASAPRIDSTPGLFCPRAPPLVHPNVQATPARHRLAQATYKTPSTQATVPEAGTASAVSFCFASAVADHPSPLATFLHQLSHATYESEGSAAESAPATHDDTEADFSSPQPQKGPTPFQDFMKYLTQATYHSPGTKADQPKTEICRGGQSNSGKNETVAMPLILAQVDKEMPAASPVRLSEEGMAAWLQLAQMSHAIKTPARNQLQDVWRQAREAQHLSQMAEEASNVREENAALQHQLADIETSLQQLTQSNEATLQDIQVQRQVAITEGEKAKRTAQQLLALAHQTSKVTEAYEAERQALRKDVTRAQTQLLEAQASSRAAEAAANTSHEEKAAMAETLSLARDRLLAAEEVMQAQAGKLSTALEEKARLDVHLQHSHHQLTAAHAAATAAGHTQDGDLHLLKAQLKEAHEAVYEVHQDQQMQAHLTADLAHQEQENAALRDAIAAAQQQLHDAAAAAASRVLAEKALEGEQQARQALEQAHSLAVQEAQAKQTAQEQENALLAQQLQEATEQLLLAQTTEQPVALQIFVMDDTCSRVAATLTPAKTCSSSQSPAAAELESVIQHAAQQLNRSELHIPSSDNQTDSMSVWCTPRSKVGQQASACATPEARAAAAHLLRGLGMTQSLNFELGFDLEPEWPAGPPPSLAASPLVAPAPAGSPMTLPAELIRTLNMSTQTAFSESYLGFESELSSSSLEQADFARDNPKAPHSTPSASQGNCPCTASAFTLDAEDIITAFNLAHEQLRSTPATARKQAQSPSQAVSTPASFLLPRSQEAAGAAADFDEVSPVVKTTRQVSSVLAAVADLEAAQGVSGKHKMARPCTVGTSRFLLPSSADTTLSNRTSVGANSLFPQSSVDRTPASKFSTQFFQPLAAAAVASANNQATAEAALSSGGNPLFGRSNMANPLFSPAASSPDPMLTPFYTPASMSSIRTGLQTPASKFAFGGKEDLAGNLSGSPAGLATPGSGVVTGDWRSVTDRLQALRAQLQSAQKKLKATSEEKQKRSAPAFSSTPLADVTPRHSQSATPLALSQQYDRAMSASPLLIPAALAGQENVEEHCLSANRWLRGLAEECVDNMYTPAKPQATNDIDVKPQGEGSQAVTDGAAADRDEDRVHVHKRELVSHPIIPTSPSTWDGSSVMSSPALSVHSPFPESAPAPMSSGCRLVVHCNRTL